MSIFHWVEIGGGNFYMYRNLMATFILGGLWHGAGWTFIFWGFLHGLALSIHRLWQSLGFKISTWLAWLITFNFINIAWVFFRAREWDDAMKVLEGMVGLGGISLPNPLANKLAFLNQYGIEFGRWVTNIDSDGGKFLIPWLLAGFILILVFKNSMELKKTFVKNYKTAFWGAICFIAGILSFNKVSEFLYFNF